MNSRLHPRTIRFSPADIDIGYFLGGFRRGDDGGNGGEKPVGLGETPDLQPNCAIRAMQVALTFTMGQAEPETTLKKKPTSHGICASSESDIRAGNPLFSILFRASS
jgi:hypothetical protein